MPEDPNARPWMTTLPSADKLEEVAVYARRLLLETDDGLPAPNAELAEIALSLMLGSLMSRVGLGPVAVVQHLERIASEMKRDPSAAQWWRN